MKADDKFRDAVNDVVNDVVNDAVFAIILNPGCQAHTLNCAGNRVYSNKTKCHE